MIKLNIFMKELTTKMINLNLTCILHNVTLSSRTKIINYYIGE